MIEVRVKGIFITQTQASGIILKELSGQRTLPIVIGEYEAQSIAMSLENLKPPRPITHDLTANMLNQANIKIQSVLIADLKDNTYYARIKLLQSDDTVLDIDARPSDAIALALRLGGDIFVSEEVMDEASYVPDAGEDTEKNFIFPDQKNSIDDLDAELKRAVEQEEYEKAAEIRDKIDKLKHRS